MRIKICCIAGIEEARLALAAGADALGLVSAMPSGPGVISEDRIAEVAAEVAGRAETFLLTALQDPDAIAAQHARCGTTAIQLVDALPLDAYPRLRGALRPGVRLVQVVHVTGSGSVDEARAAAPHVDALLLDSGDPTRPVKQLGGTGRVHDWRLSRRIRDAVDKPVWLAGGLRPDNAADAVRHVRPYGLDVCSGVRTGGRLDPSRLAPFIAAARRGDHEQ